MTTTKVAAPLEVEVDQHDLDSDPGDDGLDSGDEVDMPAKERPNDAEASDEGSNNKTEEGTVK